jgi:high-affinity nickel-transport protein
MELAVALMLMVLGLMNLAGARRQVQETLEAAPAGDGDAHVHVHTHGDYVHSHRHGHGPGEHLHAAEGTPLARLDGWLGSVAGYRWLRPLIVGIVHGLAGSAAVALLVLAIIPNRNWALAYLLLFGAGTIAGMMLITMAVASGMVWAGKRSAGFGRGMALVSGLVSLAFGLVIAYQIGWVQGLFTANPQWIPR